MGCSLPGSSVDSPCKKLEWIATPFSRGSSRPRDWTHISCVSCAGMWILYHWATWEKVTHTFTQFSPKNPLTTHCNGKQSSLMFSTRSSASKTLWFCRSSQALSTKTITWSYFLVTDAVIQTSLTWYLEPALVSTSSLTPPDVRFYSLWILPGRTPISSLFKVGLLRPQLKPMPLI